VSLRLIDDLDRPIDAINRELRASGADHPYVPLLLTVPGIGWVLAFTIAAEIGDITRFASPKKLCGYTGLCPRVYQSGDRDSRGPPTKQGPKYLRWASATSAASAAGQIASASFLAMACSAAGQGGTVASRVSMKGTCSPTTNPSTTARKSTPVIER
jgi:transposase